MPGYARHYKESVMTVNRVSEFLKARAVDGRIVIELNNKWFSNPVFIGSSEVTSASPGSIVPVLTIFPKLESGQEGLVVIRQLQAEHCKTETLVWPLRISLKDAKPWIDLGDDQGLWSPGSPEYVGGVVDDHLEVCLDGKWYRSDRAEFGKGCIPDPNLICRYLVGKAPKEELLAIAIKAAEEASVHRQLEIAQDELESVWQQNASLLEEKCMTLASENERLTQRIAELESQLKT